MHVYGNCACIEILNILKIEETLLVPVQLNLTNPNVHN